MLPTTCYMIAGLLCLNSCSFFQKSPEKDVETVAAKTEKSNPQPVASPMTPVSSPAQPVQRPLLNDLLEDDPYAPVELLPGDRRGGLRTPDLPTTLPLTLDGKINEESQ